jgi:two-component system LytT family sensor kinase
LRFARDYLDVEQERLGARLQVTWTIGADTTLLRVPTMCLLPLIENAIAYAIALNTVASLLGTDGARARATVQNLSGMLRHTLERSSRPLTTVEEELQFVRDYLDIERERFGSRLQVTYDIDPATAAMAVPTMSLQPLVENAIKHAVTNRLEGGHVRIAAGLRIDPPRLVLSVEDDGPGFAPGSEDGTGLGNLRARLRTLYGADAELATETLPTGARVSLTVRNPS